MYERRNWTLENEKAMIEGIEQIKNSDVSHLQDNLLMVFWKTVKEEITELLDSEDKMDFESRTVCKNRGKEKEEGGKEQGEVINSLDGREKKEEKIVAESDRWKQEVREGLKAKNGCEQETIEVTVSAGELPPKLVAVSEELIEAIDAMMMAFKKGDIKAMSDEIRKLDEERDGLLRGLKKMVKAMASMTMMAEKQEAGEALLISMKQWKLDPKKGYVTENLAIRKWIESVTQTPKLSEAAEVLELTESLERLEELNESIEEKLRDRRDEQYKDKLKQQREKRKESERCWRQFVVVLNAAIVMEENERRYQELVTSMNAMLRILKRQMMLTRKKNPRRRKGESARKKEEKQKEKEVISFGV